MTVTNRILELDKTLSIEPFEGRHAFRSTVSDMLFPVGISVEEGEMLYVLILQTRPNAVLELGTGSCVSTRYMDWALHDLGHGVLDTVEHNYTMFERGKKSMLSYDRTHRWYGKAVDVLEKELSDRMYDFAFVDTEIATRIAETNLILSRLSDKALVVIHDMPRLSCPEFFVDKLEAMKFKSNMAIMGSVSFELGHGMTILQVRRS